MISVESRYNKLHKAVDLFSVLEVWGMSWSNQFVGTKLLSEYICGFRLLV